MPCLRELPGGVTLQLKVKPKARANAIAGVRGDALLLHVTAAPADNEANRAVARLLAETLGVARAQVEIVAGQRGRDKVVKVKGVSAAQVQERLPLPP